MTQRSFIESRGCALLMCVLCIGATLLAWFSGACVSEGVQRGFLLPSPSLWIGSSTLSLILALLIDMAAFVGVLALNRVFNFVRDNGGDLMAGLFMALQGATAVSTGSFSGCGLMLLVTLANIGLLYSVYQRPDLTRRVFAVFFLLGAGALTQYGFLPFVVAAVGGCLQMRVMSMRAVVAILAGLLTPLWIVWGLDIDHSLAFTLPRPVNPFSDGLTMTDASLLALTGLTMTVGVASGLTVIASVFARNARTRAFNGLILVTGVIAGLMCMADFTNMVFYVGVLNLTTAYQLATFYIIRRTKGARIALLVVLALFAALYIWSIL